MCGHTDFLIGVARLQPPAIDRMKELVDREEVIFTTIINVAECYAGAFRSGTKNAIEAAKQYIKDFSILVFEQSALIWGKLYNQLRSSNIGDRDLFIASIALSNGQELITKNIRHFERVPNLSIESW